MNKFYDDIKLGISGLRMIVADANDMFSDINFEENWKNSAKEKVLPYKNEYFIIVKYLKNKHKNFNPYQSFYISSKTQNIFNDLEKIWNE